MIEFSRNAAVDLSLQRSKTKLGLAVLQSPEQLPPTPSNRNARHKGMELPAEVDPDTVGWVVEFRASEVTDSRFFSGTVGCFQPTDQQTRQ
jgi:hypothetical protein